MDLPHVRTLTITGLVASLIPLLFLAHQSIGAQEAVVFCAAPDGTSDAEGSCWEDPFDLMTALNQAEPGSEVWIRQGRYTPGDGVDAAFYVPDDVTVIGGFSGSSDDPEERSRDPSLTVLDGLDERYTVLIAAGVRNASVSSLTVQNGAGTVIADDATDLQRRGGGIYVSNAEVEFSNLIVANNAARFGGGGLYVDEASNVVVRNSTFQGNRTTHQQSGRGGAIRVHAGNAELDDVTIRSNQAFRGGGLFADSGTVRISNSLIAENSVSDRGGGISVFSGQLGIQNSRIVRNLSGREGGGLFVARSGLAVALQDTEFSENVSGEGGGGAWLAAQSVTLSGVDAVGNDAGEGPGGGIYVEEGDANISESRIQGNRSLRGGGLAVVDAELNVVNILITGNAARPYGEDPDERIPEGVTEPGTPGPVGITRSGIFVVEFDPLEPLREDPEDDTAFTGGGLAISGESDVSIINATIAGNSSDGPGPALHRWGDNQLSLVNAILSDNQAFSGDDPLDEHPIFSHIEPVSATRLLVDTSLLDQGCPEQHGVRCRGLLIDDPLFHESVPATDAPTATGDFRLWFTSPAVDAADDRHLPSGVNRDLDGNDRIVDKRVSHWANAGQSALDLGPLETQRPASLVIRALDFQGSNGDLTVSFDVRTDINGHLSGTVQVDAEDWSFSDTVPGRLYEDDGFVVIDGEAVLETGALTGFKVEADIAGMTGDVQRARVYLDSGDVTDWAE